jgi:hypothetical protein
MKNKLPTYRSMLDEEVQDEIFAFGIAGIVVLLIAIVIFFRT